MLALLAGGRAPHVVALKLDRLFRDAADCRLCRARHKRHSCATLLLEKGRNLNVVAERLGHAGIMMAGEIYAHVTPTMQQDAADALNDLFGA